MKNITTVTEKTIENMVKNNMRYANELAYILQEMKCRHSCLGATVHEMKKWNIELENRTQINLYISNELRGMSITFEKYITVVDLYDLHHANIKDFNGLVKSCYNNQ